MNNSASIEEVVKLEQHFIDSGAARAARSLHRHFKKKIGRRFLINSA